MDNYKKIKPLFNYIGGKSWLANDLKQTTINILEKNKNIENYTEPFVGGMGAFLSIYDILLKYNIKNIFLNDINNKIINFYNNIINNPYDLINEYNLIENKFKETIPKKAFDLHKTKDKEELKKLLINANSFYINIREDFNIKNNINLKESIYLLFLQNHCFNGVYRENLKGQYNTPFNWEAKIFSKEIIEKKILEINGLFKKFNINFSSLSFEKLEYNNNTLYYLDPPYINEKTIENKYNKNGFDNEKQKLLINKIKTTNFIYSNHDNDMIINEFIKYNINYNIKKIPRKNIISSSNESRKNDKIEVLIWKNI